jgi:hypothetical protein
MRANRFNRIPLVLAFLLILPIVAVAGQFKVTRICDGDRIKAQGHDVKYEVVSISQ